MEKSTETGQVFALDFKFFLYAFLTALMCLKHMSYIMTEHMSKGPFSNKWSWLEHSIKFTNTIPFTIWIVQK